ncbi:MAG: STAS domain-containing protein [Pseudomonadota bacterium]
MSVAVSYQSEKQECIIQIIGKFNFEQLHEFKESYSNKPNECSGYILDLREANHMDSSALGMLVNMRKTLGDEMAIRIINARPQIKKVLSISHFDRKFFIE